MAKRRFEDWACGLVFVLGCAACSFTPKTGASSTPGAGGSSSMPASGGTGAGTLSGSGGTGAVPSDGGGLLPPPPPSVDANCGQVNNPLKVVPPDVLLIQDRSGSMDNDDDDQTCRRGCGANSKWSQVTVAVSQVVTATQSSVNWGLKFFADGSDACGVLPTVAVPVGPNSATAIANAIAGISPSTNTPTRAAIQAGTAYLMSLTDPNPKYILLATDGEPNCPSGCVGNDCATTPNPDEETASEMAVAAAVAAGFKVFVVGIGNVASAVATLNQLAINGGVPQSGGATSYYAATDQAALEAALNQIVGRVASCTLPLPARPQAPTNVIVEDVPTKTQIPMDPNHAEGWDYTDASDTAIQLYGTACANVTTNVYSDIEILEGCPGTPINIGFEGR